MMLDRPLLVVIVAINYAYCSHATFLLELLQRLPNAMQQQAIDRLRLLIRARSPGAAVHAASSGRKTLLLVAPLQELFTAASALDSQRIHTMRSLQVLRCQRTTRRIHG